MMADLISFDAEKASRYLVNSMVTFAADPADTDYQRGYLAALFATYIEGLGKDLQDDRIKMVAKQIAAWTDDEVSNDA